MGISYGPTNIGKFGDISTSGLFGKRYTGGQYTNPDWFKTATLHGDTATVTSLSGFTSSADTYSWMFLGYFKASTTQTYTFFGQADDAVQIWVGNNAISGYTNGNALVTGSTFTEGSGTISLVANTYYPIRIMFGENLGNDYITVNFSTPTITKTTNGSGYYFGGLAAWNRFGAL